MTAHWRNTGLYQSFCSENIEAFPSQRGYDGCHEFRVALQEAVEKNIIFCLIIFIKGFINSLKYNKMQTLTPWHMGPGLNDKFTMALE